MKNTTQLYGITPDELTNEILERLKKEIIPLVSQKQSESLLEKDLLTIKQVVSILKISKTCLHDWVKKGILKSYKVGNRTYFYRPELRELIFNSNNQRTDGTNK